MHFSTNTLKITQAYNQLAFKLLYKISQDSPRQNIVFSPFSIGLTLALCINGAKEETLTELQHLLNFGILTISQLNHANQALIKYVSQTDVTGLDFRLENMFKIKDRST